MKTFVVTIIYHKADPFCYEMVANTRTEAFRVAWNRCAEVVDHIKKISVVMK